MAQAREAAQAWSAYLDNSLSELQVDHVDAYYLMGVNNAALVGSEEVYNAFETARQAGKVSYFGISTHENAAALLEVAIETGWYALAQIAITPAGWYDKSGPAPLAGYAADARLAADVGPGAGRWYRIDRHEGGSSLGR